MALLETWRKLAYETEMNQNQATQFWGNYFNLEKEFMSRFFQHRTNLYQEQLKNLQRNLMLKF